MNNHNSEPNKRWRNLVQQARADVPPAIDVPDLVREVRAVALTPTTWWNELASLFEMRGAKSGCVAAICLLAVFSLWQVWQTWQQVIPWVQIVIVQTDPTSTNTL